MARKRHTRSIIDPKDTVCANCQHFHRHYVKHLTWAHGEVYSQLHVGHCSFPQIKDRFKDESCPKFVHSMEAEYYAQQEQVWRECPIRNEKQEASL